MSRQPLRLAALALTAVISGCGSSPAAGTGTGATANDTTARAQKAVQFAQCMRAHGVSQFPDPGASGRFTIESVVNGSSLDPSAPAFQQALGACKDLEPAGFTGSQRTAPQQRAGIAFAQCIRNHGVPDFPDPLPNGPLVDTKRIPSTAEPGGMSALHAAMQTCHGQAAAAGVSR